MCLPRVVYHSNYQQDAFSLSFEGVSGLDAERVEASYGANTRGRIFINTLTLVERVV